MRIWRQLPAWASHLAVGLGFVATYSALRALSLPYWTPQMGLRLAFVLLLPRRYWPTLLGAEVLALAPWAYNCVPQFGWGGALAHLVPFSLFAMLPVWLLRDHLPELAPGRRVVPEIGARHMVALLACIMVASLLSALDSTLLYNLTIGAQQDRWALIGQWAPRYLLGPYLGCLTVAPLLLAVHDSVRRAASWRQWLGHISHSRLLLEGGVLGISALGFLSALSATKLGVNWQQAARMAMFLPVAWMAILYGWRGAAAGVAAASVGIMLAMPSAYDASTIQAQAIMAILATILLPVGARIGMLNEQQRQSQQAHRHGQQAAQRELYQMEMRMRDAVQTLGQVQESLQEEYSRLLQSMRRSGGMPEGEERRYQRQLMLTKHDLFRVANAFHPVQWQRRGLSAALWDGPIAQTLHELQVPYGARVAEAVKELSPAVQLSLYRMACEAVAHMLSDSPRWPGIRLDLRVYRRDDLLRQPWVVLSVSRLAESSVPLAMDDGVLAFPHKLPRPPEDVVRAKLGAAGLQPQLMDDRARVYGGKVRAGKHGERLLISMLDSSDIVPVQSVG